MSRVNITLPDNLLEQMDRSAQEEGISRSKLIRVAVHSYFELREQERRRAQRGRDIQRAIELQDELRGSTPPWDGIAELRRQRRRDG